MSTTVRKCWTVASILRLQIINITLLHFFHVWLFQPWCFQGQFALTVTARLIAQRRKMDHFQKLKSRNAHCDLESVRFIVPQFASVACAAEHSAEQDLPCMDHCLFWYWNITSKLCNSPASHLSQHHDLRHLSVSYREKISFLVWSWLPSAPVCLTSLIVLVSVTFVNFTIGTTCPTHIPPYSTVIGCWCLVNNILFLKMLSISGIAKKTKKNIQVPF